MQETVKVEQRASPAKKDWAEQFLVQKAVEPGAAGEATRVVPDAVAETPLGVESRAVRLVILHLRAPMVHRASKIRVADGVQNRQAGHILAHHAGQNTVIGRIFRDWLIGYVLNPP